MRQAGWWRVVAGVLAGAALSLLWPASVQAQQIGFSVGRFVGDELADRVPGIGGFSPVAFGDATIYGVRARLGLPILDLEGSIQYGPSSLSVGDLVSLTARFLYAEAGVAVAIIPTPIAPFVTAGIGLHRIGWEGDNAAYQTLGYYAGVGLRLGLGGVGARVDLRDHITPFRLDDLDPDVRALVGLPADLTLHNFELSLSLMLKL